MMKKRILFVMLVVCAVILCACQKEEKKTYSNEPPAATQAAEQSSGGQQLTFEATPPAEENTVTAQEISGQNFDDGTYDPASEEGGQEEILFTEPQSVDTPAPTFHSEYAGPTPVLIDPIDKPTPTPLPKLSFSYVAYEAPALHLTFQGPSGWIVDDSASDTFVLTNPDTSMDYAATAVIRVTPVNTNYTKRDLEKEVSASLTTIQGEGDFSKFERSKTATRSFLNKDGVGVYANYTATTKDGVKLAGRILIDCKDKNLYILHCSYPQGLAETFKDGVFNKIRSTMKIVQPDTGN